MKTQTTHIIKELDIDCLGHVTYTSYIDAFLQGREDWFKKAGAAIEIIFTEGNLAYPIIHFEITYLKESFLGDVFRIVTIPAEIGTKSFSFQQSIYNNNNELITKAKSKHVMFNVKNRKSVHVIKEIREHFPNN